MNERKESPETLENKPIFLDTKGRRKRVFHLTGGTIAAAATILGILFIVSVLINPFLPQLKLRQFVVLPQQSDLAPHLPEKPLATKREAAIKRSSEKLNAEKLERVEAKNSQAARREMILAGQSPSAVHIPTAETPVSIGFYVNWDDSSFTSLKQNIRSLDWVVPEWIRLSEDPSSPLVLDIDQRALEFIHQEKPEMPILPLLQNYKNEQWNTDVLKNTLLTEQSRRRLVASLLETIEKNHFGGITIDIEEVPPGEQSALFEFISELHGEFQKRGLILAQAVPFDNPDWNYRAYAKVTDYMMLMAYDQHWSTGTAGPVAGQDWFDSIMRKRMTELDPAQTVICFGNYGYNWSSDSSEADTVTFQESLLAAKESLDSPGEIEFDSSSTNPHFTYQENDGKTHEVWFLDAVTAYNEIISARQYHVAGFALWRLGSEDPSLWNIFGSDKANAPADTLRSIKYGYDVDFEGTGEILQVVSQPQDGTRTLEIAPDGRIGKEAYQQSPSSYVIQRTGDDPGKIVLTFDDGPDPAWTPKILDILKQENVKAAFFIVGQNGQDNPDLVRRIVNEGHEIGNHSFTHPNLGEIPASVTDLELNTTQRLIESLTGHSTLLFRAPYFGDAEPRTPEEVGPASLAQDLGYISVGLHIDPDDWKTTNEDGSPHTADEIVDQVLQGAAVTTPEERGSIVLLHDSGGDRSATVAALPQIIEQLRARGYEFTTVSNLAHITPEQAMPTVPTDQSFYVEADSYFFYAMAVGGWLLRWIFLIGIILGIGRMIVIGILAFAQFLRSRRREHVHYGESFEPFVSVIVPAFNEEKVICRTIDSLLASDHTKFEIIVVDDGSSDATFELAKEKFGSHPNVSVFTKENGGKAEALNYGWLKAKGDVIIALDADTLFLTNTISSLAHRFADEKIGAVAGNAKVGNRINVVTKWQALEYVTSQNFDRRAFASLNCITVVPGAVGAWRRTLLEKTGGFSSDTLAEDQDLTITVRKLGYTIGYEENAIAFTEAPDDLNGLSKQRFRWSYGTLQCMWKHRNALLNPKFGTLGFIAMPNVWIFQVIFPLISPLMDLVFIWTLIGTAIGYFEHQQEYAHSSTNLNRVVFYYALFLAVDLLGAVAAFLMEKGEKKSLLGWLLIQRFGYRQVMYIVMVRSVYTAIRGALVGWGKLERKATVEANV